MSRAVVILLSCLCVVQCNTVKLWAQENRSIVQYVPETCIAFTSWDYSHQPSADSSNHTERLLAEPDVKEFGSYLKSGIEKLIMRGIEEMPPGKARLARQIAPQILESITSNRGMAFVQEFQPPGPQGPGVFEGAIILQTKDPASSSSMAATIAKLIAAEGAEVKPITDGSTHADLYEFQIPGPEVAITIGSLEDKVFVGTNKAIKAVLNRINQGTKPKWYTDLSSHQQLNVVQSRSWVDLASLRAKLVESEPRAAEFLDAFGFNNLQSLESCVGLDNDGTSNRILLNFDGQPTGLFALFGDQGISESEVSHLPSDSWFAVALSVDPIKVLHFVEETMERFDPHEAERMDEGFREFGRAAGIDFRRDLIESIGSTWTLHNGSADGFLTGMTLTASVRDRDRLQKGIEGVIDLFHRETGRDHRAPKIARHRFGNFNGWSIRFQGAPVPVEPSWCVTDDKLIVTLYPSNLSTLARPLSFEPLIDSAKFNSFQQPVSGGTDSTLIGLGHNDTRRQFEMLYPWLQIGLTAAQSSANKMPREVGELVEQFFSGFKLPPSRAIAAHLQPTTVLLRKTSASLEMETRQTIPMIDATALTPIAVAMLLPAVEQVRQAAKRTNSSNNLRQMALAAHNHEATFGRLPAGWTTSKDGKKTPLLSWRVQLLPFLEENVLYDQFRHDEPWDSEHNIKLLEQMPEIFKSPTSNTEPGFTVYRNVGGTRGIIRALTDEGNASRPASLGEVIDGTSCTIMILEAGDHHAVPWTKPDPGIDPDVEDLLNLFGGKPGGNFAMGDGSVHFRPEHVDKEIIWRLMIMNDRKLVSLFDW